MLENVIIREAVINESKAIIGFMIKMAKETENIDLDKNTVEKGVNAVFCDSNKGIYYVALLKGSIIGSLLITKEWSDWRNAWVWWIQSVFIVFEFRHKGVFSKMFGFLENELVKDTNATGLRLYVDKRNQSAIKVYEKLNMDGNHYQFFEKME